MLAHTDGVRSRTVQEAFVVPAVPDPVPVTLDPARSAVLALDLTDLLAGTIAACLETIPRVRALLDRARGAGAAIVFSTGRGAGQAVLPALAPRPSEPVVSTSADKFHGTELARHLIGRDVVVLCGTNANGSILYTAMGACARGLTVVVADDGISSKHPFGTALARWQLLHQPGFPNLDNAPLRPKAVTLSRTDLIGFAPAGGRG